MFKSFYGRVFNVTTLKSVQNGSGTTTTRNLSTISNTKCRICPLISSSLSTPTTTTPLPAAILQRNKSYWLNDFDDGKIDGRYTQVEKSYAEWPFVEAILTKEFVPQPPSDLNKEYPSGWAPQDPNVLRDENLQYFVARAPSHMLPVYTIIDHQLKRRRTKIKRVEGNIWQLDKDITWYLNEKYPDKVIRSYVHEPRQMIWISGEYEQDIKDWLISKGF